MDIKALITKNDLELPQDEVERLKRLAAVNSISYLSPDKESTPFMLYCMGDTFEEIALKTNLPEAVVKVTAMKYEWHEKSRLYRMDVDEVKKDIAKMVLAATHIAVKKELSDVLSGKLKSSSLIPKNVASLEKLMDLVDTVHGVVQPAKPKAGGTVIQAQNVQINNNAVEYPEPEESKDEKEAKYGLVSGKIRK